MYDTILVPTDGSAPSEVARDHAIALAKQYDATIHALYVVDDDTLRTARIDSDLIITGFEDEGEKLVSALATAAETEGVSAHTAVVHGRPHTAILDYAAEHGVDLIVMGTHGRHGVERFLLGSVTERVVRTSDVPVLTVRAEEVDIDSDAGSESEPDAE